MLKREIMRLHGGPEIGVIDLGSVRASGKLAGRRVGTDDIKLIGMQVDDFFDPDSFLGTTLEWELLVQPSAVPFGASMVLINFDLPLTIEQVLSYLPAMGMMPAGFPELCAFRQHLESLASKGVRAITPTAGRFNVTGYSKSIGNAYGLVKGLGLGKTWCKVTEISLSCDSSQTDSCCWKLVMEEIERKRCIHKHHFLLAFRLPKKEDRVQVSRYARRSRWARPNRLDILEESNMI